MVNAAQHFIDRKAIDKQAVVEFLSTIGNEFDKSLPTLADEFLSQLDIMLAMKKAAANTETNTAALKEPAVPEAVVAKTVVQDTPKFLMYEKPTAGSAALKDSAVANKTTQQQAENNMPEPSSRPAFAMGGGH